MARRDGRDPLNLGDAITAMAEWAWNAPASGGDLLARWATSSPASHSA
ncbi:hypothetical protein [Streptomyces sp. NPDC055287]